jgi:hypothetical protein
MESSVYSRCQPKFRILDDAQIGCIHHAVLRILDNELDRIWKNVKSDFKTADHVQRQGAS